jgi:ATP-dependent DNA ligase
MNITQILTEIASDPSTNAKKAIIASNVGNDLLKQAFFYAYNPRFNFWIKADSLATKTGKANVSAETFKVLDRLVAREVTGNAAREVVTAHLNTLTQADQQLVINIMNHDLRCGASDTLASKVWPKLVPEYPVMLCDKFNEKTRKYLEKFENKCGYNVSLKEDGGRVLITVEDDGKVVARSRNGSELNVFGLFDADFSAWRGMVFDGELIIKNADGTPDRKFSNGIYTKLVRNTATKDEVNKFTIVLWDVISLEQYLGGVGEVTYADRWESLIKVAPTWSKRVKVVEGKNVKTIAECLKFYDEMRDRKQEGAIIKVLESVWEDKRSKNSVKLKAEESADLLCIGTEPGQGKYAGMIGNLICSTSCGKLVTGVGTGLKDDDRAKDPSEYVGKIIEVGYNEVISAKGRDTMSLFLPVYKQVRFDKSVANSLKELK